MIQKLLTKLVGTKQERELKRLQPRVQAINALEPELQKLSDAELAAKTAEFRQELENRLRDVDEAEDIRRRAEAEALEALLVPAFAVVREAARRTVGMRPFDVQLIGGMVLHEGKIAEMKTGEGKTLVATLPAYLNALLGRGVHVVTVNDYLAKRDAEWMGPIYKFLGLEVGVIVHGRTDPERQAAYRAGVTYGTNNEFGFDYLRDNMKFDLGDCVQRGYQFGIVDEVDSILIDEKHRSAAMTEEGVEHVEKLLGVENLYDPIQMETLHHVQQGLRAHALYKRDVDYVVKDGEVLIVDEFTGRLMPGRRWSDGLHQAVEAKEG